MLAILQIVDPWSSKVEEGHVKYGGNVRVYFWLCPIRNDFLMDNIGILIQMIMLKILP